jgi:hypothetical protein
MIGRDILLKRRLAKVKVKIDCAYNGWKITGVADDLVTVAVNDPDYDCTLDWGTGILSGTDLDQGLSYTISDATRTDQTSNEVTVIPNGSNAVIKFKADAVSRDALAAIPTAEKSAMLAQALSGGVSYTITVRLRVPIFARSNIYWDGSAMDFVRAGTDGSKEAYQGLYFKWGSLMGISPVGDWVDSSTPVYTPGSSTASTYLSWASIPYEDSATEVGAPNTTPLKGDICTQIDPLYRLPESGEFGPGTNAWWDSDGWTKAIVGNFLVPNGYEGGTYTFTSVVTNAALGITLPASGGRHNDGRLKNPAGNSTVGSNGTYWFSSAHNETIGGALDFYVSWINMISGRERSFGFSVRCVQK